MSARRSGLLSQTYRFFSPSMRISPLVRTGQPPFDGKACRRGVGTKHKSRERDRRDEESDREGFPEIEIPERARSHETSLIPTQMEELFAGKFPADYYEDVIHIKTSYAEYRQLANAFEKTKRL